MVLLAALAAMAGCAARKDPARDAIQTAPVEKRDITVTVEATGTVEPIDLVEVKSKASGQILRMPVQVGSVVRRGALLAQIDTVDVQNQYDQAYAALEAAQAKREVSGAQKGRADGLFAEGVITADEHESATLDFANAKSSLVKARTDLDIARQRLADATVSAPIDGTVLEQPVAVGQVISSATSSVSGGTTLLKMADLSRIRVRALVAETDIGSVHAGSAATVQVDAYPQRTFQGVVEKIEPQAVQDQSVTMFPVLVSITNEEGLLLPGMNGEVTVLVAERSGVLSIPVDAVRSMREMAAVATALGYNPDSVRARIQEQMRARFAAMGDSGGRRFGAMGDSAGRRFGGGNRSGARPGGGSPGGGMSGGGQGGGQGGAGRFSRGSTRGGQGGFSRGGAGGFSGGSSGFSGGPGGLSGGAGGFGSGNGSRAGRGQVVFVKTAQGFEPRLVRIGVQNFDYAQVTDGLTEGDEVALLSVAELQAQRNQDLARFRQRVGSTMPGAGGGSRSGGR